MRTFGKNVNYNFAYSNCWANKITETFEIEEFEKDFKFITEFLDRFGLRKKNRLIKLVSTFLTNIYFSVHRKMTYVS